MIKTHLFWIEMVPNILLWEFKFEKDQNVNILKTNKH